MRPSRAHAWRRTWPVSALLRFQDTTICRSLLVLLPLLDVIPSPLHHANVYYVHSYIVSPSSSFTVHRTVRGPPSRRSVPCARCGRQSATTLQPSPLSIPSPRPAKTAAPAGPANLVPPRLWPPCPPRPRSQPPIFVRSALAPSALESWASSGTQNSWARGTPSRPLPLVI